MANLITLVLVDPARRPFVATLYHNVYCETAGACSCRTERYEHAVSVRGQPMGTATARRALPRSIGLQTPGDRVEGLHPAVLKLDQVRDAVRAGRLRAERVESVDAPPPSVEKVIDYVPEERKTPDKKKG